MNIINILRNDGIGVLPTDTLYGIVGSAFSKKAVERIYKIKGRNSKKPFIVLISSIKELNKFNIKLNKNIRNKILRLWPGKVSIIFPCRNFRYLHRGTKSVAFRIPNNKKLIYILRKTGPLVAPSCNPEGEKPAETIKEARKYFGDKVDFYLNNGKLKSKPSTIIEVKDDKIIIIRQGAVKISSSL